MCQFYTQLIEVLHKTQVQKRSFVTCVLAEMFEIFENTAYFERVPQKEKKHENWPFFDHVVLFLCIFNIFFQV